MCQVLTTLPGVATMRAAAFAAYALPIERFPTAEWSATLGLCIGAGCDGVLTMPHDGAT